MSENATPAAVPPGWYPDGGGTAGHSGQLRWWTGTEWSEHTSTPYSIAADRPVLPADRPVYSVFIWLIVLLPLLSVGLIFTYQPNFDYLRDPTAIANPYGFVTPGYLILLASGWVLYALNAVFAWRDVVWLRKQGVVRPFPWPWILLYSPVYVIGRSVIVHRVAAPRGRAPIWVFIGVIVLSFVVAIVWSVLLVTQITSQLPDYTR